MTYQTIVDVQSSRALMYRIAACAASEGTADPVSWAATNSWALAAQPGWAAAWGSFKVTSPDYDGDPGRRDDVITDGMILSAVQSLI